MDVSVVNSCQNVLTGTSGQMFMTLITALYTSQCKLLPENRYPPNYASKLHDEEEFDFIIVGGGSAGPLLANRLSAVSEWKVLLIEAGDYPSMLTEIPGLWCDIQKTNEDWSFKTEPSTTCCSSLDEQICRYPRGKVLGGSGAINAMLYLRSYEDDHDRWVKEGNIGWDYQSALRFYNKFENLHVESSDYGKGGELNISDIYADNSIRDLIIEGYRELGYGKASLRNPIGYGDALVTIAEGTRTSGAKAFLAKISHRTNLYVALKAQASRILFNQAHVNGVEVRVNQKLVKLRALKEGSINSPQILMNSGIGPKEHLESIGISVKQNLRVGENFQDHPVFLGLFLNINKTVYPQKSTAQMIDDIYQYVMHKKGVYAIPPLLNLHLYANTKNDSLFPNLQINHIALAQNSPNEIHDISIEFNLPLHIRQTMVEYNKKSSNIVLFPKVLKPISRGKILLRSTDSFDPPKIYPNYLGDNGNVDMGTMLEGIRLIQNVLKTNAFDGANPELIDLKLSNCMMFEFDTDDYWKCALRNYVTHLHHPSGTCKMGPKSDPKAVVDTCLKVHNVKGLRVIDASIMPTITSGNTNAPAFMIAEKGAELIIEEWSTN